MKTERLFYENVYLKEFDGKVLSCEEQEGTFRIILDRTAFYPEGGGQPAEGGILGEYRVIDVQEDNDEIVHITDGPLDVGTMVHGKINWERRFTLMQQHSGEHIVSGLIHKTYGYDNVGFHMGSDVLTIDLNGMLTEEQLQDIEDKANRYLWEDHAVNVFFPGDEEIGSLDYRSKKELTGQIRLVEYPGADLCACCGTHVAHTGEIGLIKLISVKKFRDGVRIEMLCGKDALDYLNVHFRQNSKVAVELSVKPEDSYEAVTRLENEILDLKTKINELKQAGFIQRAKTCEGKGNVLLIADSLDPADLRRQADAIMNTCGGICAIFSGSDDTDYKYAIGERDGNVRDLVKEMNSALNGRGGGKPFFNQGSLKSSQKEVRLFFEDKNFFIVSQN